MLKLSHSLLKLCAQLPNGVFGVCGRLLGLLLVTLQKSSELLSEIAELLSLDQLSLGQDRSLHLAQHVRCHFGNQTLESQKITVVLFLERVDAPLQLLLL